MDNLINDFFSYLKKGDVSILLKSYTIKEKKNMTVIVIKILSWLKLERKRTLWKEDGKKVKHKPMRMFDDSPWCQELENIVENEEIFSSCFKISNKGLEFLDRIPEEEREKARKKAYDRYNPPAMT